MVTKEQFANGILTYIDKEVIPSLPSTGKWGIGTLVLLGSSKAERIIDELLKNRFFQTIEVVNADGLIDIDRLSEAVCKSAERYGKLSIDIPIVGVLTFSSDDVKTLTMHIKGGSV